MKVPNNMRGKSSQKFTFVRLFEFYSSSVSDSATPKYIWHCTRCSIGSRQGQGIAFSDYWSGECQRCLYHHFSSFRIILCLIFTTAKLSSISVSVADVLRLLPIISAISSPLLSSSFFCCAPPSSTF